MSPWLIAIGLVVVIIGSSAFFGAPYVPSRKRFLKKALTELYPLNKHDVLVDVGSGDGVVLRYAASRGARAIGYEINAVFILISRFLSRNNSKVQIKWKNFWTSQLPDQTTVVYIFSVSRDSRRMAKKLQREANRLQRPLHIITFGSGLVGHRPIKTLDAYQLYQIHPLQIIQP